MNKFITGRIRSIKYALKGFFLLVKTEDSIKAQISMFSIIVIAGGLVGISNQEWMVQTIGMGMVLSTEGMNTAVEEIADFVHKNRHPKIGLIKDVAAGAVTFSMITLVILLLLIYIPYFI